MEEAYSGGGRSMSAADRLAQQLGSSLNAPGNGAVFRAILTLLSEGAPVPKAAVARALGLLEKDASELVARIPSLELDDAGDIVGARVTSPCAATGAPVRLVIGPEGIGELEPASAVVSLHLFEGTRDVRSAFCRDVNFFASEDAAAKWLHTHPEGWVLPVAQAHALARELARQLAMASVRRAAERES